MANQPKIFAYSSNNSSQQIVSPGNDASSGFAIIPPLTVQSTEPAYVRISDILFSGASSKNAVSFLTKYIKSSIPTSSSRRFDSGDIDGFRFVSIPVGSFLPYNDSTNFNRWMGSLGSGGGSFVYPGAWGQPNSAASTIGVPTWANDTFSYNWSVQNGQQTGVAFGAFLTAIPDLSFLNDYDFDDIYFGIRAKFIWTCNTPNADPTGYRIYLLYNSFYGNGANFNSASNNLATINLTGNVPGTSESWISNSGDSSYSKYEMDVNNLPAEITGATGLETTDTQFLISSIGDGIYTGYSNFQINAKKDSLQSLLKQIMIGFQTISPVVSGNPNNPAASGTLSIQLQNICWILHKSTSTKSECFSALSGRAFASTWGRGKNPTGMITGADEMLEHLKRLQNWSELAQPPVNVGKEYDPAAKISRYMMDGSFDEVWSTNIGQPGHFHPSFQVLDASEAWTETISRKLCKSFGMLSYIDNEGNECVESFVRKGISGLHTLTFRDLTESAGQVIEPQQQDVYCEPIVQYLYDAGADKLQKMLAVTNTNKRSAKYTLGFPSVAELYAALGDAGVGIGETFSAVNDDRNNALRAIIRTATGNTSADFDPTAIFKVASGSTVILYGFGNGWDASYTPGFDNSTLARNFSNGNFDPFNLFGSGPLGTRGVSDGEYIWTYCSMLFQKYGQVEKCPGDFSEQKMIGRYVDALGYLVYQLQVMQYCRIDVSTFYRFADDSRGFHPRALHFGQHIALSLPMLGSGGPYECLVEKISKDKIKNRVKVTLVILDSLRA